MYKFRYSSKLEIAFLALFNSAPGKALKEISDCHDASIETEIKDDLNSTLTESEIKTHLLCIDSRKNQTNLKRKKENESVETLKSENLVKKYDCELCNFNQRCEAQIDANPSVCFLLD